MGASEEGLICHVKGFGLLEAFVELCGQALGILPEVQSHRERGGEPTVEGRTGWHVRPRGSEVGFLHWNLSSGSGASQCCCAAQTQPSSEL